MSPELQTPPLAGTRSFLVRDAIAGGSSRGVLAHQRWHRPFRGVRAAARGSGCLVERALHYVPRLRPDDRFGAATALGLLGCPIRVPLESPVDISSPADRGQVRCRGVRGHRYADGSLEYPCSRPDYDDWIPLSAPFQAVLESAESLPFSELVIALDYFLLANEKRYDPHLGQNLEELSTFAKAAGGRGVRRFRNAAALARVGAESRMETLMRLSAMRVGMPELTLQVNLHDVKGEWIGRYDAADPATQTLYEYDGEQHLFSRRQRRRDSVKLQAARDAGWRVLVLYPEDVLLGVQAVGRQMAEFSGRAERRINPALARLLDEQSGENTEPAELLRIRNSLS